MCVCVHAHREQFHACILAFPLLMAGSWVGDDCLGEEDFWVVDQNSPKEAVSVMYGASMDQEDFWHIHGPGVHF